MTEAITNLDFRILDWIQSTLRTPFLDGVMKFLSTVGEWGAVWIALGIVLLFFRKTRRCGVLMLISMALAFLVGEIGIKHLVCRVRPCNVRPWVDIPVARPSSYSFPSGHSSSSFACATIVWYHHRKLGIAAFFLAALIAFSRLYNYVHYPSDVLVGAALGVIAAVVVYKISLKVAPKSI